VRCANHEAPNCAILRIHLLPLLLRPKYFPNRPILENLLQCSSSQNRKELIFFKFEHIYKNTSHQQMHKESFIINCNTLLHVSTLLGYLQGEPFVIVTLRLHFIVE
jgi:hypothetical protein